MISSAATLPPYQSNRRRAYAVVALFEAFILHDLYTIFILQKVSAFFQQSEASQLLARFEVQNAVAQLDTLSSLQVITYIITGLAFLLWIYRAYQNLTALDVRTQDYSPSWAAGGFFVPIVNLVRPYQVVSEIWRKSDPAREQPDPFSRQSSLVIAIWWLAFILSSILGQLSNSRAELIDTPEKWVAAAGLLIASTWLRIVSAFAGIFVIKAIEERQAERAQRVQPDTVVFDQASWNPAAFAIGALPGLIMAAIVLVRPTSLSSTSIALETTPNSSAYSATPTPRPSLTPPRTSDHVARSRYFLKSSAYNMAVSELSLAIQDDPRNAELYVMRGIANSHLDAPDAALRDFSKAIELDPAYVEAYYERGLTHLDMKNYGLAGKDFEQALHLDSKYVDAYIGSGWTHYLSEDYPDALTDINRALELDADAIDAYHVRGLLYLDTGKYDQSIADFTRAIELEPDSAVAFNRRGMAYHSRGDLAEALQDFDQAIKLEPDFSDVYFNRGLVHYDQGNYQVALTDYGKVIAEYPDYGPAYIERAATYGQLQQFDLGIADLEQALKLDLDAVDRSDAEQMLLDFKAQRRGQSS